MAGADRETKEWAEGGADLEDRPLSSCDGGGAIARERAQQARKRVREPAHV